MNLKPEDDHPKRIAYDNEHTEPVHKANEKVKAEVQVSQKVTPMTRNKVTRRHKCEPLEVTK